MLKRNVVFTVVTMSLVIAGCLVLLSESVEQRQNGIELVETPEQISAELKGKKLKNPQDAALARKMKAMMAAINGDFDSMMSYGSKVGYVPPASESIREQALDGTLTKSPDIPDPPAFRVAPDGIVEGFGGHPASISLSSPAESNSPIEVSHSASGAVASAPVVSSIKAKEAALEAELRKLKEQDLEAKLAALKKGGSSTSVPQVAPAPSSGLSDATVHQAVKNDASFILHSQSSPSDASVSHAVESAPTERPAQAHAAAASGPHPYVADGIKYKSHKAYLLAMKMKALQAQITGDFSNMLDYGNKVGYVAPATESIKQQALDGSLGRSPDIPDPPAFKPVLSGSDIEAVSAGSTISESHPKAAAAPALAPAPIENHVSVAQGEEEPATKASQKESEWEKKFGFLKKDEERAAKDDS